MDHATFVLAKVARPLAIVAGMSGRCTGWVLKHGPRDRAMRSVLIVIADAANSEGEHSHPGLDCIIEGSLYGRAHVLATLKKLEDERWIEIVGKRGPGRATTFNVHMDRSSEEVQRLDLSDEPKGPIENGQRSNPEGHEVQSSGPDTSSCVLATVSTTVSTTAPTPSARPLDLIFEALVEVLGYKLPEITGSQRGAMNAAGRDLRAVGATPDEIRVRAQRYRQRWPSMTLSASALAKHWPMLASDLSGPPPMSKGAHTTREWLAATGGRS